VAIERHATSKLAPDADGLWDLLRIHTMGFRGEALPSIGSVARLSISSRAKGAKDAHAILVEGGQVGDVTPAAFPGPHGARIEVRDLFYATPARLKFMKSERAEALAITEEIKRQAMAHEAVGFSLDIDGRRVLRLPPEHPGPQGRLARLSAVLGRDFQDNAIEIDQTRDGVRLTGLRGAAHLQPRQRGPPVPVRQRPARARPAAAGRAARRLCRLPGARSPPDGGALCVARHRRGRRQRPPRQGRGAVPRSGPGARPDRRRRCAMPWPGPVTGPRPPWRRRRWTASAPKASWVAAFPIPSRPLARRLLGLARGRLDAADAAADGPAGPVGRLGAGRAGLRRRAGTGLSRRRPGRSEPQGYPRSHDYASAPVFDPVDFPLGAAGPRCTRPISSPRPATAWSSSTSTPPTSAWSMSA
jgi:DNA mismatch repair protein MutL